MKVLTTLRLALTTLGLALCLSAQPAQAAVTVTVLPTNQVVLAGSNPAFTAQVNTTAGETITSYSWQMSSNGLSPFTTIAGATGPTCTLTNVQTANAGYYFAKVYSNSTFLSVSEAARLIVQDQARIISQPQGGLVRLPGSNATFSVTAAGAPPLAYQWRLNGVNLQNGPRITGATGTNLTVNALVTGDSGSYVVVVSNLYAVVTSQVATLGVFLPVGISAPPQNTAVIIGSNAVLSVTASGSAPFSYQWRFNETNTLANGGQISGATSNVLTIAASTLTNTGDYTVLVSNPVSSLTSAVATLTVLVPPAITSATNLAWRQGLLLSFTNTATGTTPMFFGAAGLPAGLSIEPTNGVISGIPAVEGVFNITIFATNAAMTVTGPLTLTLANGAPIITSGLTANGRQGSSFSYTIAAINDPVAFTASPLPSGLSLNPTNGVISGVPVVTGSFPVTIGVSNPYGSDTRMLTLNLSSGAPLITSSRTAFGTENQSFSYSIRASNTPILYYGASDLPLGLTLNTTNGLISGTTLAGGTYTVPIWAVNSWGTGLTNLVITVGYSAPGGLAITGVVTNWGKPYLLDFKFSLRDGPDPSTSNPLVVPPSALQVICMEDGVPISPEAPLILQSAYSKQLKTHFVLDYTYSMYEVPGEIDRMEAAAQLLINTEPPNAKFGIVEFNAEYIDPRFVTNSLTSTTNYFISDKTILAQSIGGIRTNYVQGDYASSRCWDAMNAALENFGANNLDEQRYLMVMSDGNDESSLLNGAPGGAVNTLIKLAKKNGVAIYCVGYGNDVNTSTLQQLASETGGRYYLAATADLGMEFQKILLDLDGQYTLRWATLKRTDIPACTNNGFQPSFQITYDGMTASWNTDLGPSFTNITEAVTNEDGTVTPGETNICEHVVLSPFNPPDWTGDVKLGRLRLAMDADLGPTTVRLRATYAPRSVRMMRLNYRPNYPCTTILSSTNANEILYGWTMTDLPADTNGLRTLTLTSWDTNNLASSIPYAAFGDLVEFHFTYPDALTTKQAFSVFTNDNTLYTNVTPSGIKFTNENFASFITPYAPVPPHGTPIPWLAAYKFPTNNPAATELLIATNGLPLWQTYLAGLNPTNVNSRFAVWTAFAPGQMPQISFSTVMGRTYRLETATSLTNWSVLRDNMPGIGGNILFIDNRNLSGVRTVFYRVAVY